MDAQDWRRKRFKAALKLAGLTIAQWAETEGNVTRFHLHQVLAGRRASVPLNQKIDAFADKHLGKPSTRRVIAQLA